MIIPHSTGYDLTRGVMREDLAALLTSLCRLIGRRNAYEVKGHAPGTLIVDSGIGAAGVGAPDLELFRIYVPLTVVDARMSTLVYPLESFDDLSLAAWQWRRRPHDQECKGA